MIPSVNDIKRQLALMEEDYPEVFRIGSVCIRDTKHKPSLYQYSIYHDIEPLDMCASSSDLQDLKKQAKQMDDNDKYSEKKYELLKRVRHSTSGKAIFDLSEFMQTKKVWIGSYGGHYDVIVIFKEEPDYIDEDHDEWSRYNTTGFQVNLREEREKKNVIGNMDDHTFRIVFPDCDLSEISEGRIDSSELFGRPLEIEVSKVIEVELTAPFDDDGYLMNMGTDVDGWN